MFTSRSFQTCRPQFKNSLDTPLFLHDLLGKPPRSSFNRKRKNDILVLKPERNNSRFNSEFFKTKGTSTLPTADILKLLEHDNIPLDKKNTTFNKEDIDKLKPESSVVSQAAYLTLKSSLLSGYNAKQLHSYVKGSKTKIPSRKKNDLAELIITKVWDLEVTNNLTKEDVIATDSVRLSHLELFLLQLSYGYILRRVKNAVSSLDLKNSSLVLKGTPAQVENAKIVLQKSLENYYKETIDLGPIKRLADIDVREVGANTEVFFNHVHDDVYEICTLHKNQLKRTKRLLLWLINHNLHQAQKLYLANPADLSLFPFKDDGSLTWKDRRKSLFRLKTDQVLRPSDQLSTSINQFSADNLSHIRLQDETWVDEEKPLISLAEQRMSEEWDILTESLKQDVENVENRAETSISLEKRDEIYKELTDFSDFEKLNGVGPDHLDDKFFTMTLGEVLVEEKPTESKAGSKSKSSSIPTIKPFKQENQSFIFNPNVPLAHDKVLDFCSPDSAEMFHDPNMYSLQFKFMPSPYIGDFDGDVNRDVDEQVKYPPVELWVQLKENLVPDVETLQIVTVEGEKSGLLNLPNARSDVKISCQQTGRLLEEPSAENEDEDLQYDIRAELNSTSDRYSRFDSQPGVKEFLNNSVLDYSGKKQTSIAPHVDLVIGGKTVRYNYVNVTYRREIMVPMDLEKELLVNLSVVEGGQLGGKRTEIQFLGDYSEGDSRENFDNLLDRVLTFIETL